MYPQKCWLDIPAWVRHGLVVLGFQVFKHYFWYRELPAKIEKTGQLQRKELQVLEFLELDNVGMVMGVR